MWNTVERPQGCRARAPGVPVVPSEPGPGCWVSEDLPYPCFGSVSMTTSMYTLSWSLQVSVIRPYSRRWVTPSVCWYFVVRYRVWPLARIASSVITPLRSEPTVAGGVAHIGAWHSPRPCSLPASCCPPPFSNSCRVSVKHRIRNPRTPLIQDDKPCEATSE